MSEPTYKVTAAGQSVPVTVSEERVARFCLHACGGGYNERQTANAMMMLRAIRNGKAHQTASGITIEVTS